MANRRWIALYSQTGEELLNVSKRLSRVPNVILTDTIDPTTSIRGKSVLIHDKHKCLMESLRKNLQKDDIVTLHGYLNIIPKDILGVGAEVYNGHPGLITLYPELRGLDPQERVVGKFDDYPEIGCVIHRVTEEVDGGEVLAYSYTSNTFSNEDDVYSVLHTMSENLWVQFLREVLK